MQTAIMDPEDGPEPSEDRNWYDIQFWPQNFSGNCNICGTGWSGGNVTDLMQRIILCGLGHVLAGRRYIP